MKVIYENFIARAIYRRGEKRADEQSAIIFPISICARLCAITLLRFIVSSSRDFAINQARASLPPIWKLWGAVKITNAVASK